MRKIVFVLAFLALSCSQGFAEPAWYVGKITRVWVFDGDGSFILTLDSGSLDDCLHKYAYFKGASLPPDQLKASLGLALSAFHANSTVGIVIDKSLDPVNHFCQAMSIDLR